jgi:glutamyl-tRNA synthetase
MVELFSLERIGQANAKFNREKLLAFNTEACATSPTERMVAVMRDFLSVNPQSPMNAASDEELRAVLKMNAGMRILREVEEKSRFLFVADDALEYSPEAIEKVLRKNELQGYEALKNVLATLQSVTEWNAAALEEAVKKFCETSGLGLGKVAQPIRVAVSGSMVSPPIFETLAFLGRERTLWRVGRCLEVMGHAD